MSVISFGRHQNLLLTQGDLNDYLLGILSQRLLKRICKHCIVEEPPGDAYRQWVDAMTSESAETKRFWRGRGCPNCNNTGYQGRIAVAELLEVNGELARTLRREDVASLPEVARSNPTFRPLHLAALDYAFKGITTLEEVIRLSSEEEDEEEECVPPVTAAPSEDLGNEAVDATTEG